ncbi:MAG: hypothetical protein ABH952_08230 [Candidatus Omnitrophota bacterium]
MLKAMGKGFNQKQALRLFERCNRIGLNFEISLIFNFPGEDISDYNVTKEFIRVNKKLIPKIAQVNPFIPLDGTEANNLPRGDFSLGLERVQDFVLFMSANSIKYTKAFINNLRTADRIK